MKMTSATLALAALLAAVAPAHAEPATEPVVLPPDGPWNADFGEKSCRLARFFGTPDNRHALIIEQYWTGTHFGLSVAGRAFERLPARQSFALQFFEGQQPIARDPLKGEIAGYGAAHFFAALGIATDSQPLEGPTPVSTNFPVLDTEIARQVRFVSLRSGGEEVRLESGSLRNGFKLLNQCTQNLVASWGLDLEKHLSATRMPHWVNETQLASRFTSYIPFQKIGRDQRGIVRIRLFISDAGKVTDCAIIEAPDVAVLERPICKAMERARFEPALDAVGKPMDSYYVTTIIYATG